MRTRSLLVAAFAATTALAIPAAHADTSKAWSAAKANLPGDSTVVVGINFTSIRKSQLFAKLYPLLIAQKPEIQQGLDLAKTACHLDPLEAVDGAVVGTDADQKNGAVYIALHNLDQTKLVSCFEAVAREKGAKDAKVTIKKDGNISEMTSSDSPDKIYMGWIGSDVLVIAFDSKDKAALQKWMGGKGGLSHGTVGRPLGKINTNASGWAVVLKDQDLGNGLKMKAGYGSVDLSGGNIAADFRVQVQSAADATKAAADANKQLAQVLTGGTLPPAFQAMAKSVKITSAGDELNVTAKAAEADVLSLLSMFLPGAHP